MPRTRKRPRKRKHDASYKKIFAHRRTVADLLRGFAGKLAGHLEFSTLERLPASFVTEHLGQRHADMLWKIQTTDGSWLYLLVLLEFQSTVDHDMALRMLDYTVRVLQGLGSDDRGPGDKYPPLLPVVIYNGERRWTAATDIRELFATMPDQLLGYRPRHQYLLLDLRALDPTALPPENVVSLIAMLERARSQRQLEKLGASLADWLLRVGETRLLDSFEAWIRQVLSRTDAAGRTLELRTRSEEEEMATLAERVRKWGDELNQQWLEKGIEKGIERGIEQGIEQGRQQGERQMVFRLAAHRFGPGIAEQLAPLLDQLSDPDRIAAVATMVLECETAEEFIARAREA